MLERFLQELHPRFGSAAALAMAASIRSSSSCSVAETDAAALVVAARMVDSSISQPPASPDPFPSSVVGLLFLGRVYSFGGRPRPRFVASD